MHLTNQHMQRIATSRVPPPMQLPFPNGMGAMMPYLPATMGPQQPRNYFPQAAMQTYRAAQPRWSSTPAGAGMRPTGNAQMIGMQMPPSAMSAAQRSAMANMTARAGGMQMNNRPTATPGQMMSAGIVRPQGGVPSQQATAYTRNARNIAPAVRNIISMD